MKTTARKPRPHVWTRTGLERLARRTLGPGYSVGRWGCADWVLYGVPGADGPLSLGCDALGAANRIKQRAADAAERSPR